MPGRGVVSALPRTKIVGDGLLGQLRFTRNDVVNGELDLGRVAHLKERGEG